MATPIDLGATLGNVYLRQYYTRTSSRAILWDLPY